MGKCQYCDESADLTLSLVATRDNELLGPTKAKARACTSCADDIIENFKLTAELHG